MGETPYSARRRWRVLGMAAAVAVVQSVVVAPPAPVGAAEPCDTPANEIVAENCLPGSPASAWEVAGAGDPSIQGFATDMSVDQGQTIDFKIDTTATDYRIDIYRLGYYGGSGARLVDTIATAATTETVQPPCLIIDGTTDDNLVDCGNWSVSASWSVPAGATSGLYIARPTRADDDGASHIAFVVRDDDGGSDLLFQTSDTTWQAYNSYGGYSLYSGPGHAHKVSYNRPFVTRGGPIEDWLFNAEYPMLRWLERNGYDVSYFTGVDADRFGPELLEHEAFLSVGHDEYWSAAQRANVETARDAGVDVAFFSGNEVYWKTRWEPSTADGGSTDHRTLVAYKEGNAQGSEHHDCFGNFACDPDPDTWTGLWRQNAAGHDGGRPENALSGQISWHDSTETLEVPAELAGLRFWRNTSIADLTTGSAALAPDTLGYEWNPEQPAFAASYPAGRVSLTRTEADGLTHTMSLYRAPSGALVFGAGTVQWPWGLDGTHDRGSSVEDPDMQQATVNLLSDMGAQPGSLQAGLVAGGPLDTTAPTATITDPAEGSSVAGGNVVVSGTASDGGAVALVEVSTDGGATWARASGTTNWTHTFTSTPGPATVLARAVDDAANIGAADEVDFEVEPQVCPCSIFGPAVTGVQENDTNAVELGVRFRADVDGFVTGIRFYKTAGNTGTHTGTLWSNAGTPLATVTFAGESGSGWQEATFDTPVAVEAGTTYVASYHTTVGFYAIGTSFAAAGVDNPPLHALQDGLDGANGVYLYGSGGAFPTSTFGSSNYLVDVVFAGEVGPDETAPTIAQRSPAPGATGVSVTANVTARFSEPMAAATISGSTVELRDGADAVVDATVTYDAGTRTAILDPGDALTPSTGYTATVQGGSGGVTDVAGNVLAEDVTWTFTTAAPPPPPPDEGPGGPILVVSSAVNPFSRYYVEILRNEGLNAFDAVDITSVTPATLADHDVVILGEIPVDAAQAAMLAAWVEDGGNLIAMRPDADLDALVGVVDAGGDLSEAYLRFDTSAGMPGAGLVAETIQFHGTADRYDLDPGTEALATLWSSASVPTTNPAVTLRSVGSEGGQVAAFAYDLARSVVQTRQGNPAWAGQERDGQLPPILRSDDLFFPDWIDFSRIQVPQADEQQRLLANVIQHVNRDVMPLPRFWYFPRGERAVVVMTGDDHASNGTPGQFDWAIGASPAGCDVDEWECVRGTSYLYPSTPLSDAAAAAYEAQGFEVGIHVTTGCADWTPAGLAGFFDDQLTEFAAEFPSVAAPSTNRTHCITWSDWASHPTVELAEGIRLDTNYYYWPAAWVNDRPGYFTGSGMPMRFADLDGSMIDVYQAATQMTDESGMDYGLHISTLLDNALGTPGYYGVVTANMHTDSGSHPGQQAVVNAALARGVPVVSARQMLTWLDGRNGSSFADLAWDGTDLTFSIAAGAGSTGLQAMLPTNGPEGSLAALTLDDAPVPYATETIKGIEYAVFAAGAGSYAATYALDDEAPVITSVVAVPVAADAATVTWTTDEPSTTRVDFGTSAGALTSSAEEVALTTSHEVQLTGLTPDTPYFFRVSSTDGAGNTATEPGLPAVGSFTTPTGVATDTTFADFAAGTTGGSTYVADSAGGELILAPALGAEFQGPGIPAGWSTGSWTGGTTTVTGGSAVVDGSWLRADGLVGAGRAVEFAATFTGDQFQNAGFGVELDGTGESWAMFGTNATSGVLQARTLDIDGAIIDVALGAQYIGSEHVFRIEWDTAVRFYVDGALVHTAATVGGTMRPVASDFQTGGGALALRWMRMTPYASPGTFLSRIHDAGNLADWGAVSFVADLPVGSTLALSVRTGPSPTPDGSWSSFAAVAAGDDVPTSGRYLQYRVEAASPSGATTPALASVTLPFTSSPDTTAPTVSDRAPAPGATDVPVDTDVIVTFDEPVVAVDWATAVTLRAEGSGTDLPAIVTADGSTVTLDPDDDLASSTEYTVTVAGSVTDTTGNPLGADDSWSFTTTAPVSFLVDDSAADFGDGTPGGGAYVSTTDDGEVTLEPTVGAEFGGAALPAGWTSTLWSGGPGGSTVGGGAVVVDGALLVPDDQHGPGRSIEFVATFGAQNFQHVGFGVDLNNVARWAMFSTHNTGGTTLYARTHNGAAAADVPLAAGLIGSPHRYRIDWLASSVVFSVDGTVVHTQAVTIAGDMRPVVSDFAAGGATVTVDWLRMGPYATDATFTSRVLDAGAPVDWRALVVTDTAPAGTSIGYEVRTGDTADPDDGSWSAFTAVVPGGDIAGASRYVQYRAALSTSDPSATPVVARVAVGYVGLGPLPVVTGGVGSLVEGDAGSAVLQIPVTLSAPSAATVRVDWATLPSADPVPDVDYEAASGTLVFLPGETEQHIELTVLGDTLDEPGVLFGAEWLFVQLTPTNATLGSGFFAAVAHALIFDNDPPPIVTGGIASVVEGDSGSVVLQIPVTLSAPSGATVTVNWATLATTGLVPGQDYDSASGTVTFTPGDTEEVVSITVHGDELDEPGVLFGAEWLFLQLSSPVNATFGSSFFATVGHGFIVDDD